MEGTYFLLCFCLCIEIDARQARCILGDPSPVVLRADCYDPNDIHAHEVHVLWSQWHKCGMCYGPNVIHLLWHPMCTCVVAPIPYICDGIHVHMCCGPNVIGSTCVTVLVAFICHGPNEIDVLKSQRNAVHVFRSPWHAFSMVLMTYKWYGRTCDQSITPNLQT